jgi:uncharacterized protein YbjT (DUF2867 family)
MTSRTALLAGATGLVGTHCLDHLLAEPHYRRVVVLARRPVARPERERLEVRVVDFDQLDKDVEAIDGLAGSVDDVYCCLGTTIRAAGSREAYYRVDHDYPVMLARLARAAGATRLALVSSIGASPGARNYYLRMKGEVELDVTGLGYDCLELFRPSMLLGRRERRRLRESAAMGVMRAAAPVLAGPLRPYRPVAAERVAGAMVAALGRGEPGTHVRTFDDIARLAP